MLDVLVALDLNSEYEKIDLMVLERNNCLVDCDLLKLDLKSSKADWNLSRLDFNNNLVFCVLDPDCLNDTLILFVFE